MYVQLYTRMVLLPLEITYKLPSFTVIYHEYLGRILIKAINYNNNITKKNTNVSEFFLAAENCYSSQIYKYTYTRLSVKVFELYF